MEKLVTDNPFRTPSHPQSLISLSGNMGYRGTPAGVAAIRVWGRSDHTDKELSQEILQS